jgi:glyoxylase I family protein
MISSSAHFFSEELAMPAPFAILGIDHVVLRAVDPAGLERFYVDVLGCTFEKRQDTLTQLRAGSALIDIVPADAQGPAGGTSRSGGANLDHLCLRIDPFDSAAIARHLAAHGAACGAEASRYGAQGQGPSVYLTDPEGNGVELKGPAAA